MVSVTEKKNHLKKEYSVLMLNSNPEAHPLFEGIRLQYSSSTGKGFDSVIMFAQDENEFGQYLPKANSDLNTKGFSWLSEHKKSKNISSPFNNDITWNIAKDVVLEPIRLESLNTDSTRMHLLK